MTRASFGQGYRALLVTAGVVALACYDSSGGPPPVGPPRANQVLARDKQTYSPTALHDRNPMDWVGRLHNAISRRVVQEISKPGTTPSHVCSRLAAWFDDSTDLAKVSSRLSSIGSAPLKAAWARTAWCQVGLSISRHVSYYRPTSISSSVALDTLSTALDSAFSLVDAALGEATDPNDLASRLSPILDGASSLGEDSTALQGQVAIAQSSYEEWYAGTEIEVFVAPIQADMEPCLEGQLEHQNYELDGVTYTCLNGEWLAARFRNPPMRPGRMKFVSYGASAFCGINWESVAWADAGAGVTGITVMWYTGQLGNPAAWTALGVTVAGVSSVSSVIEGYNFLKCLFAL